MTGHTLEFWDAGHVLGSSGILASGKAAGLIFYNGEVNFDDQTIMLPTGDFFRKRYVFLLGNAPAATLRALLVRAMQIEKTTGSAI